MFTVPFTDEQIEEQARKNACDEAATREVANCNTFFGRWYIEDGMLCTWVCTPRTKTLPVIKLYVYDISLDEVNTPQKQEQFYNQIAEKQWCGQRGLADLKRTFRYILKYSSEERID